MIAAWNRFFHEPADPRIPALIRIGYASLVLINLVAWFPYLEMWFGETGVLPSDVQYLRGYQWTLLAVVPRSMLRCRFATGCLRSKPFVCSSASPRDFRLCQSSCGLFRFRTATR